MLLALALALASANTDASGITWIHDDWAKAKSTAIDAGQLVAVDVWATWCHTCLSMKNFILTDAAMSDVGKLHTFVALDSDKPENAAFFAKINVGALPTFLVVDPKTELVVSRWVGSGTPQQMAAFFKEADTKSKDPLILGHRALAKKDAKGAIKIFEAALKKKDLEKGMRTRLLNGWIEALSTADPKGCAKPGLLHLAEVDDTAPGIDYVSYVAGCAAELPKKDQQKAFTAVRDRLLPVIGTPAFAALAVDDRSGLYSTLIDTYTALANADDASKMAAARLAMLEDAASKAPTPQERATFDSHRLEEYLRAKKFDIAENMLVASEKAQPDDFNPPYRLAILYSKAGRTADGLTAVDRALSKGYGGRKLRIYSVKVDLLIQQKNWELAKKTVAEAKTDISKLQKNMVRPSWSKDLDAKLQGIAKLERAS